jgi:hypothetical protein
VQLSILKAGTESELDDAFASLVELHAGALFVGGAGFFLNRRDCCGRSDPRRSKLSYGCALRVSDAARAGAGQLAAPPPAAIRGERPRRARPHNRC